MCYGQNLIQDLGDRDALSRGIWADQYESPSPSAACTLFVCRNRPAEFHFHSESFLSLLLEQRLPTQPVLYVLGQQLLRMCGNSMDFWHIKWSQN